MEPRARALTGTALSGSRDTGVGYERKAMLMGKKGGHGGPPLQNNFRSTLATQDLVSRHELRTARSMKIEPKRNLSYGRAYFQSGKAG